MPSFFGGLSQGLQTGIALRQQQDQIAQQQQQQAAQAKQQQFNNDLSLLKNNFAAINTDIPELANPAFESIKGLYIKNAEAYNFTPEQIDEIKNLQYNPDTDKGFIKELATAHTAFTKRDINEQQFIAATLGTGSRFADSKKVDLAQETLKSGKAQLQTEDRQLQAQGIIQQIQAENPDVTSGELIAIQNQFVKDGTLPSGLLGAGGGGAGGKPTTKVIVDANSPTGFSYQIIDQTSGEVVNTLPNAPEPRSAVTINQGKPASPGERKVISEARANIEGLKNINNLYKPEFVGLLQGGVIGKVKSKTGIGLTKEEAAFRSAVKTQAAELKRFYFGTAQTATELKNSLESIPDTNMSDVLFLASMKETEKKVERILKERELTIKQSGLRPLGGASEQKPIDEMTDAEVEEEIKRLTSGQ